MYDLNVCPADIPAVPNQCFHKVRLLTSAVSLAMLEEKETAQSRGERKEDGKRREKENAEEQRNQKKKKKSMRKPESTDCLCVVSQRLCRRLYN